MMDKLFVIILTIHILVVAGIAPRVIDGAFKVYCSHQSFEAQCPASHIISIQKALYGRMRASSSCIGNAYPDSLGCFADITSILASYCSGRFQCSKSVGALNQVSQPCDKDFTSYLNASYVCLPVELPRTCNDVNQNSAIQLTGSGYLAPFRSSAGTTCDWKIQGLPGQNVNISIHEFIRSGTSDTNCPIFVTVVEGTARRAINLCNEAGKTLYSSRGPSVTIETSPTKEYDGRPIHRVFKYQVYGCPDLKPIRGAYIERDPKRRDRAKVVCNSTQETWYLTCKDGEWVGQPGNCSTDKKSTLVSEPNHHQDGLSTSAPIFGVILAVLIGVVLGAAIGAGLLGIVFWCRKSRLPKSLPRTEVISELSYDTGNRYPEVAHQPNCCQTKQALVSGMTEYTHVWNVHPATATAEKSYCHQSTFKPLPSSYQQQPRRSASLTKDDGGCCYLEGSVEDGLETTGTTARNVNLNYDRTLARFNKSLNTTTGPPQPAGNNNTTRLTNIGAPYCDLHGNV